MTNAYERFCGEVCALVRHATRREKKEIAEELTAHMSDHAEALTAAGWPKAEAETKAVEAMGNAEEIGTALNREYPLLWLVLSRTTLILLLCCALLLPNLSAQLYRVRQNLEARTDPIRFNDGGEVRNAVDYRFDGPENDVIRVYAVDLKQDTNAGRAEQYRARIAFVIYDKNPLRPASQILAQRLGVTAIGGSGPYHGGGTLSYGASNMNITIPVGYGDEYVTLQYSGYGFVLDEQIPLDWEGVE